MIKAIIEELALPLNSLSVNRDFGPEILRNTFWKKILFIHGKILVTAIRPGKQALESWLKDHTLSDTKTNKHVLYLSPAGGKVTSWQELTQKTYQQGRRICFHETLIPLLPSLVLPSTKLPFFCSTSGGGPCCWEVNIQRRNFSQNGFTYSRRDCVECEDFGNVGDLFHPLRPVTG